jgi:hypothetical protein
MVRYKKVGDMGRRERDYKTWKEKLKRIILIILSSD